MSSKKEWFTDWFNTKYYHILYRHRNADEARKFMSNLTAFTDLDPGSKILDLACGRGRHSIYLNALGYCVTGADLSVNNIREALESKNETLQFIVQDMRLPYPEKYDAVFNLFTSFGYFPEDKDDVRVLKNIHKSLEKSGVAVLDYLNVEKTLRNLVPKEQIRRDGIVFKITREVKNNFIIKRIEFTDQDKNHRYYERVKCLDLDRFKAYAEEAGLKINHVFGDYQLNPFDAKQADRLILILSK